MNTVEDATQEFKIKGDAWDKDVRARIIFSSLGFDLALDISSFETEFNKRYEDRDLSEEQRQIVEETRRMIQESFAYLDTIKNILG